MVGPRAAALICWLCVTFGCAITPTATANSPSASSGLKATVEAFRARHGVPGMGAAVVRAGSIAVAVSGLRRIDRPDPITASDAFHLGSDTKAITASVVARLIERGLLHWGETLTEALPDIANQMDPAFRAVTLEMVMRHVAGLPGGGAFTPEFTAGFDDTWPVDRQRAWMTARFLSRAPTQAPGARFVYSNYDFIIIGHIVERATTKTWERLVEDEVFAPLGMIGCGFGPTATSARPDGVWAHEVKNKAYVPTEEDNPPLIGPAGTVHCPLAAWAKFASAHLDGDGGWLSSDSLHRLHEPLAVQGGTPGKDIALGWGVTNTGAPQQLTHNGSNGYNFARIVLIPSLKSAILVTCNAGDDRAMAAGQEMSDKLTAQVVRPSH